MRRFYGVVLCLVLLLLNFLRLLSCFNWEINKEVSRTHIIMGHKTCGAFYVRLHRGDFDFAWSNPQAEEYWARQMELIHLLEAQEEDESLNGRKEE